MNFFDKIIHAIDPVRGLKRAQARRMAAAYEASKPSRFRTNPSDNSGANLVAGQGAEILRGQARHLDQNHDLAVGVLRDLVNKTVGAKGIQVESLARDKNGSINNDFVKRLNDLWQRWCERPEVTGEFSFSQVQRLLAHSKYRDGEAFQQLLLGNPKGLRSQSNIGLTIQMLEADFVTFEDDESRHIRQGVQFNEWGIPLNYWTFYYHPTDQFALPKKKLIRAENMLHAKVITRIGQIRGVSVFAPVLSRLNDLKDYEESERVAARISAAMSAYIKKGSPDAYDPDSSADEEERALDISPGMVFDDLAPGEDIGIIESKRPSQLLQSFRDSMLKAVSSGAGSGYASVSKDYNGTYSSQRQQLLDDWKNYTVLQDDFIHQIIKPTWRAFVNACLREGLVTKDKVDADTLYDADFRAPVMGWIDPLKEAKAHTENLANKLISPQSVIRRSGDNPHEVLKQIAQFMDEMDKLGVNRPEYLQEKG